MQLDTFNLAEIEKKVLKHLLEDIGETYEVTSAMTGLSIRTIFRRVDEFNIRPKRRTEKMQSAIVYLRKKGYIITEE